MSRRLIIIALQALVLGMLYACGQTGGQVATGDRPAAAITEIEIGPVPPQDISPDAYSASLEDAARFAWAQFIALNWAAVEQTAAQGTRGAPFQRTPGSLPSTAGLRAWETLRTKTEIFPGTGQPHGVTAGAAKDYGYDEPPLYRYDPKSVGTYPGLEPGLVPACFEEQERLPTPWIELSESHEVGPERMYAGMAPEDGRKGADSSQRILYAVKVNREFYRYVAPREWLDGGNPGSTIPAGATKDFYAKYGHAPEAGSGELVSFPEQTLQIKTAWRQLSADERASGRFHTATARSYQPQEAGKRYRGQAGNPKFPCFVDDEWGLIGIHVKTKTATAPYYLWATFEQVDTLSDAEGQPVEDETGRLIRNASLASTDPEISATNATQVVPATPESIQRMTPAVARAVPDKRLYYDNSSGTPTTQGVVAINRRDHQIPMPVIEVNRLAHESIRNFVAQNMAGAGDDYQPVSPTLLNYKLVGIQWKPASKPVPGRNVEANPGEDNPVLRYPLVYYLANSVLETSYRLQNFSGTVQSRLPPPNNDLPVQDLITDFSPEGKPVVNVMYNGMKGDGATFGFNMGGCMGCHGQMQVAGYDFNFIFRRGRVTEPEIGVAIRASLAEMVHPDDYDD